MIPNTPYTLLIFQVIAHLAIIPMFLFATWWQWCVVIFIYLLTGCFGMTMTYHRLLSHKSWNPPKFVEYLFSIFATVGLTGSAISWVAVHREHHGFMDTPKDPHGPIHRGYFWTHFLSMFAPVRIKYASHLLRDKFYLMQHKYYFEINLFYALVLFLIDPFSLIYAWLVPAMILWNAGSSIVSISHRNGYPHNDTILALLVWGEGNHKNHHDNAASPKFGKIDLGWFFIKLIDKNAAKTSIH